ncbi:hypothetical protein K458DRAFT_388608 [Lentithecium fluviatile CBS 122367]|uniref:Uncharacterized protein n=1 Tax=Lentithecium fluviatile CBS 122367 TaxID=1168545 RepID=A0A6G1J3W6_9PLEO|nr:hypothetical protein K458DRAFT_388608 [Lentithecium fluviatile CBS 122367]
MASNTSTTHKILETTSTPRPSTSSSPLYTPSPSIYAASTSSKKSLSQLLRVRKSTHPFESPSSFPLPFLIFRLEHKRNVEEGEEDKAVCGPRSVLGGYGDVYVESVIGILEVKG